MRRIRTAVFDEHDIFRRGLVAFLLDDARVEVVADVGSGPLEVDADVAVVSTRAAAAPFPVPLVVTAGESTAVTAAGGNRVLAVLPRATLTGEQLLAAVMAASAGLRVESAPATDAPLEPRLVAVLRLLADGAGTMEISRSLNYSERTIKTLIADVERELGAKNRAQAVAFGIRRGLI